MSIWSRLIHPFEKYKKHQLSKDVKVLHERHTFLDNAVKDTQEPKGPGIPVYSSPFRKTIDPSYDPCTNTLLFGNCAENIEDRGEWLRQKRDCAATLDHYERKLAATKPK